MISAYNTQTGRYSDMGMPHDREDMKAWLKDNPEVTHVAIPNTWSGYGATLISLANNESITREFGKRVHTVGTELMFTRNQIMRFDDLAELITCLAYDYPVHDDDTFSRLETETITEHVRDCLTSELYEFDDETITDWLWDNVELWSDGETCFIDSDGLTPYMSEDSLAQLVKAYRDGI